MKSFFYMQRNDRRTLLGVLVALAIGVAVAINLDSGDGGWSDGVKEKRDAATGDIQRARGGRHTATPYATAGRKTELFAFDPNTADSTQLLRLGLAPWQVRNIYKYRAAGGKFSRPRDFARIYGLTAGQYKTLEPYIRISSDYRPAAEVYADAPQKAFSRDTVSYPRKLKKGEHVSLNTADTATLKRVPGIGSGFARAIVNYRKRLGGYYDARQLLEIEHFPADALPYFTIEPDRCNRLNVNKTDLSTLNRHPYISFYQAKAIMEYRRLHGPLHSLDELKNNKDFTPTDIERLSHYIEF